LWTGEPISVGCSSYGTQFVVAPRYVGDDLRALVTGGSMDVNVAVDRPKGRHPLLVGTLTLAAD
jgi:hypothetical protein